MPSLTHSLTLTHSLSLTLSAPLTSRRGSSLTVEYRAVELAISTEKDHTIIHSLLLPPAYGYPEENLTLTAHTR